MFLAVVCTLATRSMRAQSEALLLDASISPTEPATAASIPTPAVLQKALLVATPPQVPAPSPALSNSARSTVSTMVALAPLARAVVPERQTTEPPVAQVQPAGTVLAVTMVRPATKPGIA